MVRQISFDEVAGYATRENAIKKAEKVLAPFTEDGRDTVRFLIHVNAKGRFVPVATDYPGWGLASIVHSGVCVI
jgi:hypothetical protein